MCLDSNLVYRFNRKRGMDSYGDKLKTCYTIDNSLYLRSFYNTFFALKNEALTVSAIFTNYVENILLANTKADYTKLSTNNEKLFLIASIIDPDNGFNPFVDTTNDRFIIFKPGLDGNCVPGKGVTFNQPFESSCYYYLTKDNCASYFTKVAWDKIVIENTHIITNAIPNTINDCSIFPTSITINFNLTSESNQIETSEIRYEGYIHALDDLKNVSVLKPKINFFINFIPKNNRIRLTQESSNSNEGYKIEDEVLLGSITNGIISIKKLRKGKGKGKDIDEYALTSGSQEESIVFGQNKQLFCFHFETITNFNTKLNSNQYEIYNQFTNTIIGKNKTADTSNNDDWISIPPLSLQISTTSNNITYPSSIILNIITIEIGSQTSSLNSIVNTFWSFKNSTIITNASYKFFLNVEIKFIKMNKSSSLFKNNPRLTTILPSLPTNLFEPLTKIDF